MGKKKYVEGKTYTNAFGEEMLIKRIETMTTKDGDERYAVVSFPGYGGAEKVSPVKSLRKLRAPGSIAARLEKENEIRLPNGHRVIKEKIYLKDHQQRIKLKVISNLGCEVSRDVSMATLTSLLWGLGKKFPVELKVGDIAYTICGDAEVIDISQGYTIKFLETGNIYKNVCMSAVASGFVLDFCPPSKVYEDDIFEKEQKILFRFEYEFMDEIKEKDERLFKTILEEFNPMATDPTQLSFDDFKIFYSELLLRYGSKHVNII